MVVQGSFEVRRWVYNTENFKNYFIFPQAHLFCVFGTVSVSVCVVLCLWVCVCVCDTVSVSVWGNRKETANTTEDNWERDGEKEREN